MAVALGLTLSIQHILHRLLLRSSGLPQGVVPLVCRPVLSPEKMSGRMRSCTVVAFARLSAIQRTFGERRMGLQGLGEVWEGEFGIAGMACDCRLPFSLPY